LLIIVLAAMVLATWIRLTKFPSILCRRKEID
jgi:hypothetical protein